MGFSRANFWLPLHQALLVVMVVVSCCSYPQVAGKLQNCKRPPVIFNFGDSNSDTGGFSAWMGYMFGAPSGRVFFRRPTGRSCDGRLMIDFLCDSLGTSYLRPYLDAVGVLGTNFSNGANFAIYGAHVLPPDAPMDLGVQVQQFSRFRSLSLDLASARPGQLVDRSGFATALYTIDIGQTDISWAFAINMTYDQVVGMTIPAVLEEINNTVVNLYEQGARRFWLHNTGPLGCLPSKLASWPRKGVAGELDSIGCVATLNDAARSFNRGLAKLSDQLRTQLTNATVVYVDVFTVKYEVFANASSYGFSTPPFMACCGYGGPPYNVGSTVWCLIEGFQVCAEGTKYISWDGTHYSDAANSIFAAKISSGNYSTPRVSFNDFCNT